MVFCAIGGEVRPTTEAIEDTGLEAIGDEIDMKARCILAATMRASECLGVIYSRPGYVKGNTDGSILKIHGLRGRVYLPEEYLGFAGLELSFTLTAITSDDVAINTHKANALTFKELLSPVE